MIPDLKPQPKLSLREVIEQSGVAPGGEPPSGPPISDAPYEGYITLSASIPGAFERTMGREVFGGQPYHEPSEPQFNHYRVATRERLVPKDESQRPRAWFDCFPLAEPTRLCEVKTTLGDRLRLSYTIRRSEVREWRPRFKGAEVRGGTHRRLRQN
jgi:hypothetical protein